MTPDAITAFVEEIKAPYRDDNSSDELAAALEVALVERLRVDETLIAERLGEELRMNGSINRTVTKTERLRIARVLLGVEQHQ